MSKFVFAMRGYGQRGSELLYSHSRGARWFFLLLLLAVWSATRLPWLPCDGGVPALWEYGYFVTDEGYYLGGGKEKLNWDRFIDATREESSTYGHSPGMSLVSLASKSLFGSSLCGTRAGFFLVTLFAWLFFYYYLAKRTLPFFAFGLCLCVVLTPMIVQYERTACNDVLSGALLLIAYTLARRKNLGLTILAGFVCASAILVKTSGYLLLLLVMSAVIARPSFRQRFVSAGYFVAAWGASLMVLKTFTRWMIATDATSQGKTVDELLACTSTTYGLPNVLDLASTFRGLACFPRHPAGELLGIWAILLVLVPLLAVLRQWLSPPIRCNYRSLLYLAYPAYVAAIAIMPLHYTHYLIPLMMLFPCIWVECRRELRVERNSVGNIWLFFCFCAALLTGIGVLFVGRIEPQAANPYFALVYNPPPNNVWFLTWPYVVGWSAFLIMCGLLLLRRSSRRFLSVMGLCLSIIAAITLAYSRLPAFCMAPYIRMNPMVFSVAIMGAVILGGYYALAFWCCPKELSHGRAWFSSFFLLFVLAAGSSQTWRTAWNELTKRTYYQQVAESQLTAVLPPHAIVIGERASQVLLSSKVQTVTTITRNSDPIPLIKQILQKNPQANLFALLDTQHAYNLQHYEKNKEWLKLIVIKKVKLPSFGNGHPVDVFLARIILEKPIPQ